MPRAAQPTRRKTDPQPELPSLLPTWADDTELVDIGVKMT